MISHMENETGCLSGNNPYVEGCSDVVSPIGCLSVNMSPGVIRKLLKCNQS